MTVVCPRCELEIISDPNKRPAVSRRDGSTLICSICGFEESMVDAGVAVIDPSKTDADLIQIDRENRIRKIAGLPLIGEEQKNEPRPPAGLLET